MSVTPKIQLSTTPTVHQLKQTPPLHRHDLSDGLITPRGSKQDFPGGMCRALYHLSGFRWHRFKVRKANGGRNVSLSKQDFSVCLPNINCTAAALQNQQIPFVKCKADIQRLRSFLPFCKNMSRLPLYVSMCSLFIPSK